VTDEESIHKNEETDKLEGKMFRLKREAIREFDILKAEQGPRSGPRLMSEAIDLLLLLYGKRPLEEEHHGWSAARGKPAEEQHETKPARQTTAGSHGLVRGAMARSEQKTKTK
jgi:hypothetical protein